MEWIKEFLSSKHSLLYIAITWARQLVSIIGYGELCHFLENINNSVYNHIPPDKFTNINIYNSA